MPVDKSGRTSAGILLFRHGPDGLEVLLAHPGGPFHVRKDLGNWTIPKGEAEPGEELIDVARREFAEETGSAAPSSEPIELGDIHQKSGKRVIGWALEGDLDPATAQSNTFEMDWPPRSGQRATFPEIDRVAWYDVPEARRRIKPAQEPFLDRLAAALTDAGGSAAESPAAGDSAVATSDPDGQAAASPAVADSTAASPTVAEP